MACISGRGCLGLARAPLVSKLRPCSWRSTFRAHCTWASMALCRASPHSFASGLRAQATRVAS
eukprot:9521159-Alexandrium_andersonii.AAC.1